MFALNVLNNCGRRCVFCGLRLRHRNADRDGDLKIHIARPPADAVRGDHLTQQYYGRPPLLDTLLHPEDAERPWRKYLDWHREKVFVA